MSHTGVGYFENVLTGGLTGYVYDGAGIRVAKGGLTSFSCNFASNGYATKKSWVLGPGGRAGDGVFGGGGCEQLGAYECFCRVEVGCDL